VRGSIGWLKRRNLASSGQSLLRDKQDERSFRVCHATNRKIGGLPIGVKLEGRLRIPSAILGGGGTEIRSRGPSCDPSGRRAQTGQSRKAFSDAEPRVRIHLPPAGSLRTPLGFGVDVREADFDVLRPKRHEPPAHDIQAALASSRVIADHWEGVGRRNVSTGRDVRRWPIGRDREDELDLADIGGETGTATHGASIAGAGRRRQAADHREPLQSGQRTF
jgi:hypothetical protein